jgi:hypothetical protein
MPAFVNWNGDQYSVQSSVGREAIKWEQTRGHDYARQNPLPRMMYKAEIGKDGKAVVEAEQPPSRSFFRSDDDYKIALERKEHFDKSHQRVVHTEREFDAAHSEGWRDIAADAIEACREHYTITVGTATAERKHADQFMSEPARREAAEADAATSFLVPEVKESRTIKQSDVVMVEGKKVDKRTKEYKATLKGN